MPDNLLTISQAAKKLGVAAVTLRLWERQGKIKSLRTSGNQRRYSIQMLEEFQNKSQISNLKSQINFKSQKSNLNLVIRILNLVFFVLQFLYMKSKMTTERVGLSYAFFHPA